MKIRFFLKILGITAVVSSVYSNPFNQQIIRSIEPTSVLAQSTDVKTASQIFEEVNPTVVTIKTGYGIGSGLIFSKDGLIVTNAHVVGKSKSLPNPPRVVTVVFADGSQAPADVVGFAKDGVDLAVLQVYPSKALPTVTLAQESIKVGDRVFAIGTPLDPKFQNSFTQGQVSRIDSDNIQHDAAIFGGNSGGGLFNDRGQVVGVNYGGVSSNKLNTGLNFAIPVDKLRSFITAIEKQDISPVSTLPEKEEIKVAKLHLNGQSIVDRLSKEKYPSLYIFEGKAGQKITIDMVSEEINSVLILSQIIEFSDKDIKTKTVTQNDDYSGEHFNARIETTLKEDGLYLVVARSSHDREYGAFNLQAISNF